ncbi:MAG: NAD(P)H-hydrate dehydratase [Coriobacteriales bacterium]|jgi:NAD(P)H-hydrate epimerase|nr:NAD(P)H-hydrate dehydratase [Coriobacteriales bacterium]
MTLPLLPRLTPDANKYSRGSLLILAGSSRYFGAGVLATQAAARSGAGYVTLATPGQQAAQAARCHLLTTPVFEARDHAGAFADDALDDITANIWHHDAIVVGCGMTVTPSTRCFVRSVLAYAAAQNLPLLLDADALNALAQEANTLNALAQEMGTQEPLFSSTAQPVLTPHAGELHRLLAAFKQADSQALAATLGAVVVAKGPQTAIVNARRSEVLSKAPPALATAGTGDVLSGIIGALLAQGLTSFEAAYTGVALHSLAANIAVKTTGECSMIATDVIAALPAASRQMTGL